MQKKKITKIISVPIIIVIAIIMLAGNVFATNYDASLFNNTAPEKTTTITVSNVEVGGNPYSLEVPYSDEYFSMSSKKFNLSMARASIGLAIATMRDWNVPEDQGHKVIRYFNEAGFKDIEASEYKNDPTENSICYAIAHKVIDDYTVLCVSICGGGYKKEWVSNLKVGDGERHEGFNEAAMKVEQAIVEYKLANKLTGKIKVWVTGFSRSAAVGNLVSEDLIESGQYDDLYAYLFATPRTTKNPIPYKNIFNIIGKNDIVPKIPLAEWGYGRNGIELYTKTQETDSSFGNAYILMNMYADENNMDQYNCNPELDYQFRTIFDYLSQLMPTATDYKERLQSILIGVMRDSSGDNILTSTITAIQKFTPVTIEEKDEVNELLDYLQLLANQYVLQGNYEQIEDGSWNPDITITENLFAEHDSARYAKWMFCSDNVNDIFSSNTQYTKLTIEGKCDVEILDSHGYLMSIKADGSYEYEYPYELFLSDEYKRDTNDMENFPFLQIDADSNKKIVSFPRDTSWTIFVTAKDTKINGITYAALGFDGSTSKAQISKTYYINTEEGELYQISLGNAGADLIVEELSDFDSKNEYVSSLYSPSMVMRLERLNIPYLTVETVIGILVILVGIAIINIILSIILGIIRAVKKRKRKPGATIVLHVINIVVFTLFELAIWAFVPAVPLVRYGAMALVCIIIAGLAIKGMENKPKKRWRKIILVSVGVLMVAHVLLEIFVLKIVLRYEWIEPVIAYTIMTLLSCIIYKRSPEEKMMQMQKEANSKLQRDIKRQNRRRKKMERLGTLRAPEKEKLIMKDLIVPEGYNPKLDVRTTQEAIKYIRDTFQKEFGQEMKLERISAPLYVRRSSGLNDDLSGVERKVSFDAKNLPGDYLEIVQSLAKWKRWALGHYGFKAGEGLYTNMNAIRRDEELDNLHSIYVDQWDWERVITKEERTEETLRETVETIFKIIKHMEHEVWYKYPEAVYHLPDEIFFIDSEELRQMYPKLSPKERENAICKDKGAVFIMRIGDKLGDGKPHDGRAPDYDDWKLNGDILFWFEPLGQAFEISSMGIRVDEVSMKEQLEKAGQIGKLDLPYHMQVMNQELPYTIGGGIGQSRLCMLLLGKAHIGEVQASVWPEKMQMICKENHIMLL